MTAMMTFFLAIPAPGSGDDAWGRRYRLYGLMIAAGVIACLELARRRWQARGGDPEDMSTVALWCVPAGLIGARIYHVLTDIQNYHGHWFDNPFADERVNAAGVTEAANSPLAIWNGGLGIPGGLLIGAIAGFWVIHKRGMRIPVAADAAAVGVPLAQAVGRLGNYFNQELFGRPTDLPWGLSVDPAFRPPEFFDAPTFQPTFLYEALWNIGLMFLLIWIDRKRVLRPGNIFALYVGGYFLGRLWVEGLRSDKAYTIIAGLRINTWISILAMVGVAVFLAVRGLRRREDDSWEPYVDGHRYDPDATVTAPGDDAGDTSWTEGEGEPVPVGAPEVDLAKDEGEAGQRGTRRDDARSDAEPDTPAPPML